MEGATPLVLEDTRFGDVAIAHVALLLGQKHVLFSFDSIDLFRERIATIIYIFDCGLELREGRIATTRNGRVGDASRNEVESASNAIGLPTIVVDVTGRYSDRIEARIPAPCQILFTSFVIDSYRFDLLELLDTVKSAPCRHTQSVFEENLNRNTGLDWPRSLDEVSHHV